MKKYYNNPELAILTLQEQDLIRTSFDVFENIVERPNQSFDGYDIVLP